MEDGLPNPSVLDIMQDRQGFMWFGTLSGIVRYDGHEMKVYYPAGEHRDSLPERDIPKFYQDKTGNIWVTFRYQKAKLFRYDISSDSFIPYLLHPEAEKQIIERSPSFITEDKLGRLLIGTWGGGMYAVYVEKEKEGIAPADLPYLRFLHVPGEPGTIASDAMSVIVEEDTEGNIWIPTDDGLCKFIPETNQFETFLFTNDTIWLANEFNCVLFEKPRTLWVGSAIHGLLKFDLETERFVEQYQHDPGNPYSISHNLVAKIIKARDGKYWVGAMGRLDIFDPKTKKFTHVKGDSHDNWGANFRWNNAMISDSSGNIWLATWQTGIYKLNLDNGNFYFTDDSFFTKNSKNSKDVIVRFEDRDGYLWLDNEAGELFKWNPHSNQIRYFYPGKNLQSASADQQDGRSLIGNSGFIWHFFQGNLYRIDPSSGESRRFATPGVHIYWIYRTSDGKIWASTNDSDICLMTDEQTAKFKCFGQNGGLEPAAIYWIMATVTAEKDPQGNFWFGTNQNGLYRLDGKTGKMEYLLPDYGIHQIHFDSHGNCWMATHSGGLKLFDPQKRKLIHLDKKVTAELSIVRGIQEDKNGTLWMKTPKGVAQFDPTTRQVIRIFDYKNWMEPDKNWYGGNTSVKTRNGELYFNSPSGILYFHPDSLRFDTIPPKVALTALHLFNEPVNPGDDSPLKQHISYTRKIELAHWQNDITLYFAGLHFKMPEENNYSFKLENYDHDWRPPGQIRSANYTSLSPGQYTFRLKAANSDGVWSDETTLDILIKKPWWATWWAGMIFLGIIGFVLLGIRDYEMRRQKAKAEAERLSELDAVKSKLYTNITHEFRTPLTIILGVTEQLKTQATEGMKSGLDLVKRNGQQLLHLVNQILDLSKLESGFLTFDQKQGNVVSYLHYLTESFHSFAKEKNIRIRFVTDTELIKMDFDPQRLQQVVSNLLSNAIKFTPSGGTVTVIVEHPGKQLKLSISDTGAGISKDKIHKIFDRFYQADDSTTRQGGGTGIGLALTHELVNLMGGKIDVFSELGVGTKFVVTLPINTSNSTPPLAGFSAYGLEAVDKTTQPSRPVSPARKVPANAPLILIMEDNEDVATYIASCLDSTYRIMIAANGRQGIDVALEHIPDLIVSDVMMPEMDGYEVCNFLKNDERTNHIPIILLTAKADETSKLQGLSGGADAYLFKPFNPQELQIRISRLLALRKKLQARYLQMAGLSSNYLEEKERSGGETTDEIFIKKVREIIEANLDNNQFSVPDLMTELGMSRTQLHRKITSMTGHSAAHFVRLVRLAKAKQLMKNDALSISEISYQTGFTSPDYFSRVFKKETGMTPREYRENSSDREVF